MSIIRPARFLFAIAIALALAPLQGCALLRLALHGPTAPAAYDDALHAELAEMLVEDQAARGTHDARAIAEVDRRHAGRLEALIATHGWPTRSMVGSDGALAAWLVAQHADFDPAFQARCLALLSAAALDDQASDQHLAYLTDRVLVNAKKPQRYGTQFEEKHGDLVARPIEEPALLDKRRRQVGLPPFHEALVAAREAFKRSQAKAAPTAR